MLSLILVLVIIFSVVYFLGRKESSLPPGIWGWPLLGSLPASDIAMPDQVMALRKKYGDIFTWRIGMRTYIFICEYQLIKTALSKIELADRPELYSFDVFTEFNKIGIANGNGRFWMNNRRFALRHLRSLGMGKATYESVIQYEAESLIKDMQKLSGKPTELPWSINVAVLNVIWRIVADRRYDIDDEEVLEFQELINRIFKEVSPVVLYYDMLPWLPKLIPASLNKMLGVNEYFSISQQTLKRMKEVIKEHQATFDPENPRDYIDYYLKEMEAHKDDPESTMSIRELTYTLEDLFIAGSETTSSTLRWAIFYLSKHQDIQRKLQKEIDAVVDKNTLPSLKHRERLAYLDAVIKEVARVVSLLPLSVPHAAAEDTTLNGYKIPKGSVIMCCTEACHNDPKLWEKPDEFYPEHFLDKDGKLIKREGFMPFGTGRRICLGESLANIELFLFLGGLVQNFHFELAEGEDLHPKKNPKDRLINTAKPIQVIISKRKGQE
ncbi:hypothetical protein SK128_009149 [Halocaridina rubra]|uniref:Cytochrome P450 n=1 Tax=Halocaridina rubra TaxID=373956 RepID=A0AAN8WK88_HALRR